MALAVAFGLGVALVHLGAPLPPAPLLLFALLLPIGPWLRPRRGEARARAPGDRVLGALAVALAAGTFAAAAWERRVAADCRFTLADASAHEILARVEVAAARGRLVVRVEEGMGPACQVSVRVVIPASLQRLLPDSGAVLRPGERVALAGRWRRLSPSAHAPLYAGELVAAALEPAAGPERGGRLLRRRADLEERLARLFPERHGVVAALILARKEGLEPELREAFARAGTAHLLAISGFHVGVVAALLLGFVRTVRVPARPAGLVAATAVWCYVLLIGVPDAAARAALIMTLFAVASLRGRPLSRPGAVATAFLAMVAFDPGALARIGFQLSFLGVVGLVLLAAPIESRLARVLPGKRLRDFRSAVAAGVAATLTTLPVVAWHFDQVSLVGIPATLLTTPLVAAAIPGTFAALAADALHPTAGAFVAGGTDLLLALLLRVTLGVAELPHAVAWVPRAWVLAGAVGALGALVLLSGSWRVGPLARFTVALGGAATAVLLLPVGERVAARGTVEFLFLDVGQGDAVLVRSPGARWVLVDAGPAAFASRGEPPVMTWLRRRAVGRLEALVLTHPHLDHIGGATRVLESIPVGVVVDPGMPRGTDAFLDVLRGAQAVGLGWRGARRGDHFPFDGVDLRVLHSLDEGAPPASGGRDPVNENSVVLLVSFGAFSALLTGDAPVGVEEAVALLSGPVDLLKVGHHGSRTSTSARFLEEVRPGAAVISVGRGNTFGHPHEPVLERLEAAGLDLFRTDRDGTVRVVARRDGTYTVRVERAR